MKYIRCRSCGEHYSPDPKLEIPVDCIYCGSTRIEEVTLAQLTDVKPCTGCKHYHKAWFKPPACKLFPYIEPVNAKIRYGRFCSSERGRYGICGPTATLFEEKK